MGAHGPILGSAQKAGLDYLASAPGGWWLPESGWEVSGSFANTIRMFRTLVRRGHVTEPLPLRFVITDTGRAKSRPLEES
jgi:hypothetical protein